MSAGEPPPEEPAGAGDEGRQRRLADLDRELQAARGRATQLERENRRLRAEAERLRDKLDAVYASETFRLGERLLRVPRWVMLRLRGRRGGGGGGWGARSSRAPTVRERPADRPPADPSLAVRFALAEDAQARREYGRLAGRRDDAGSGRRRVAMAVYTDDLDEGRGDLYTAIGLARGLEPLGYDVVLLPPERWYDPPAGTDVLLALVAESSLVFEPQRLEADCGLVAWVRNNTDRWAGLDGLAAFDALLASSPRSADLLRERFRGPVGVLPIGVDERLFAPPAADGGARRGAVATLNQWGPERPRRLYEQLAEVGVDFPLAIHGVLRGLPRHLEPLAAGPVSFFALPSLYGQAAVVLDDQQDVNRRFGNVNSRVYEALAAGALPVTGAPRGLDEAGLAGVPTFGSAGELAAVTRRWLEDGAGRAELVGRLRAVVLDRHTYAARARELDAFLGGLDDGEVAGAAATGGDAGGDPATRRAGGPPGPSRTPGTRNRPLLLGFQPDYRVTNPYQDMLYGALGAPDHAVVPVDGPEELARAAAARGAPALFHLHWTATILGPARSERDATARAEAFLAGLDELAAAGGRSLWTVHNVLPHDCAHPRVEARLRQGITDRVDAIHVLCACTPEAAAEHYSLPADKLRVISHGSYVDVYPNLVTGEDARGELGVPRDAVVYLFLGQIRPYKGLEALLDAFEQLADTDRSVHLLVAGKPVNHPGAADLETRCRAHPRITPAFREVPGGDLQRFLAAADVVVLPHRRVLNSGGIQLAHAFGRPVIAPRAGCLTEQVTPETGLLFDDEAALPGVLAAGRALADDAHRRAAYTAARAYTAHDMARDFRALVEDLGA